MSIIDFGLAKKYRDPKSHIHIPYRCSCTSASTTERLRHSGPRLFHSRAAGLKRLTYCRKVHLSLGMHAFFPAESAWCAQRRA